MNPNVKRWLVSTLLTFLTGAAIVVIPELDNITLEALQAGAWVGIVFAGVRAGLKAALEAWIASRGL